MARGYGLELQAWKGVRGPEIPQRSETRAEVGRFLRAYTDARLTDGETRARNSSPLFREFQEQLDQARTPQEVNRDSADLLRRNWQPGEQWLKHRQDPEVHPRPANKPLSGKEQKLLFAGRVPSHYTAEMIRLRQTWGLSKEERARRVLGLREGRIEPSPALRIMLADLESRRTIGQMRHYSAQLAKYNHEMDRPGKNDLRALNDRLGPDERDYHYERVKEKMQALERTRTLEQTRPGRAFSAPPTDSASFREYTTAVRRHEERLLVETASQQREEQQERLARQERERLVREWVKESREGAGLPSGTKQQESQKELPTKGERPELTPQQARAELSPEMRREVRITAQQMAWADLAPPEIYETDRSPAAAALDQQFVHAMERLLIDGRRAADAREAFITEKVGLAARRAP